MKKPKNVRHSSEDPHWMTPPELVALIREALGGDIDLDPFGSATSNLVVLATTYFDGGARGDGFALPWYAARMLVNHPGKTTKRSWRKLVDEFVACSFERACWVGFSVEQLCLLADPALPGETDVERIMRGAIHPLDFTTVLLRKRIAFRREVPRGDGDGDNPSHSNYLCFPGVPLEDVRRVFGALPEGHDYAGLVRTGPLSA